MQTISLSSISPQWRLNLVVLLNSPCEVSPSESTVLQASLPFSQRHNSQSLWMSTVSVCMSIGMSCWVQGTHKKRRRKRLGFIRYALGVDSSCPYHSWHLVKHSSLFFVYTLTCENSLTWDDIYLNLLYFNCLRVWRYLSHVFTMCRHVACIVCGMSAVCVLWENFTSSSPSTQHVGLLGHICIHTE